MRKTKNYHLLTICDIEQLFTYFCQQRVQDLHNEGAQTPDGSYYLSKCCRKLHEKEESWTEGGTRPKFYHVGLDPPLFVAFTFSSITQHELNVSFSFLLLLILIFMEIAIKHSHLSHTLLWSLWRPCI